MGEQKNGHEKDLHLTSKGDARGQLAETKRKCQVTKTDKDGTNNKAAKTHLQRLVPAKVLTADDHHDSKGPKVGHGGYMAI